MASSENRRWGKKNGSASLRQSANEKRRASQFFCVLVINKHNHTVHTGIYRFEKKKKRVNLVERQ